jgi:hypothetical protein
MDAAWMFRQWCKGTLNPLDIMSERENIYRQLSQTTGLKRFPDNIPANV